MQRRLANLIVRVGIPVLVGQFLFDWVSHDMRSALGHVPIRASLIFAVLLIWATYRDYRERNKRTVP